MSASLSHRVALAALLALMLMTALPFSAVRGYALLPLGALLLAGLRPPSRPWAVATGSFMLVYFSLGVMDILTNPAERARAILYSVLAVTVLFAALDAARRR